MGITYCTKYCRFLTRERDMGKKIQPYNAEIQKVVHGNLERFVGEYPDFVEHIYKYKNKPNCQCRQELYAEFQKDLDKFSGIVSELTGEDLNIVFPGPLASPEMHTFSTVEDAHAALVEYSKHFKQLKSFSINVHNDKVYLVCI